MSSTGPFNSSAAAPGCPQSRSLGKAKAAVSKCALVDAPGEFGLLLLQSELSSGLPTAGGHLSAEGVLQAVGYIREDYTVRKHWVRRIVTIMDLKGCPMVDTFASKSNARFNECITKDQDALKVDWPTGRVMWCNPPWSLLEQLPSKMQKEQKSCLLIFPAWHSKDWCATFLAWARKIIYMEQGTKVFEVDGHPCQGVRWGLYAAYVPQWAFTSFAIQEVRHLNPSARRRRRKWQHQQQSQWQVAGA